MCEFCEMENIVVPISADVPAMDVYASVDALMDCDTGKMQWVMDVVNIITDDAAAFQINYCPMCGRKLKEGKWVDEKCGNCRYSYSRRWAGPFSIGKIILTCRRFPPKVHDGSVGSRLIVMDDDWCGEWEGVEDADQR